MVSGLRQFSAKLKKMVSSFRTKKTQTLNEFVLPKVPSAPAQIKAVLSGPNKIMVSWLPPKFSNGPLTGYTFYMSVVEDGQEEGTHKRALSPSTDMHEIVRAHETNTLQFWVTASTRVRKLLLG